MPEHTKTSAISVNHDKSCPLSPSTIAENTAPNSGFVLLNTATLETGLYFNKNPCRVNANAERKPRYKSMK